jgi:hypothetical protein
MDGVVPVNANCIFVIDNDLLAIVSAHVGVLRRMLHTRIRNRERRNKLAIAVV